MQRKNKVLIKINGQEYPIVGAEPKEYLLKVGNYVDERMEEVAQGNKRLSTSMIAVLTCINISDQFLKLKEAYEQIESQQATPLNELEKVKEELQVTLEKLQEKENINQHLLVEKEAINQQLLEKTNHYTTVKDQQQDYDVMMKKLQEKEDDLKKAGEIINDLQNKLFESQIKLVETRRHIEDLLNNSNDEFGS